MPVQGLVRLRKHQFGRQAVQGTVVAATKAYKFTGVPSVELNWTDDEADTGTIVNTAAPSRTGDDVTADLTDNGLEYNTLPLLMAAFFGGDVEPVASGTGGVVKTWTHDPSATAPASSAGDPFTYEFGDDVVTDWYQCGDGILDTLEISGPEGLGPLTTSMGWRFGSVGSTGSTDQPETGTVPTPGLAVDTEGKKVYLKDCAIYIASSVAGLGAGQVSDALYSFVMRFGGELDLKRWANGDQSFGIDEIVRSAINIELECTFAKTADIVGTGSESDAWMSDDAVNRYIRLIFTSTSFITGSTPYKWTVTMPMRYYTRTEGEVGGNTVVVLNAHAFYDPDLFTGYFTSEIVNSLTNADLGAPGS